MGAHGKIPVSARTPGHCKREWFGRGTSGGLVLPLGEGLLLPAAVHCVHDEVVIVAIDGTDEEDLDVVFDGDDFGVVYAGLPREPFTVDMDLHPHRREPELRLSIEPLWSYALFGDDAVLLGLDALFLTPLTAVSRDRSNKKLA